MAVIDRLQTRLSFSVDERSFVEELLQTVTDRIKLRVGKLSSESFPTELDSIAVDATVKAFRRKEYEGISSESADTLNTSFVDDILDEYMEELEAYKARPGQRVVRFL